MIIILENKDLVRGHTEVNSAYNFNLTQENINHADYIVYVDTVNKRHRILKERKPKTFIHLIKHIISNL